jgi:EAL domain-containing protein (putative c-di-GMP-specific phosphodiesterase class I)
MIVPLGAQVLQESCRQLALWRDERGHLPLEVSVNLSPRQLEAGDLVEVVEAALAEAGLEASSLSLEITETCLMEDAHEIRAVLRDLKRVGVQLAIDDFGTGYSSLAYLRDLPVDTLKLDQSFVRNVGTEEADRAIAEMVMGLGQTLGLRTVAEGIETPGQLRTMHELGCEVGQGFLLGRPSPPDQVVLSDVVLDRP